MTLPGRYNNKIVMLTVNPKEKSKAKPWEANKSKEKISI